MMQLGPLGFASPWLLLGLLALPILWWLLRATPPAPLRERFPGVAILLGLEPPEKTPDRTPWWLLLLRILIVGLAIFAFAQPLLNPTKRLAGEGSVRLILDGGWASAADWDDRIAAATEIIDQAARADRTIRLEILAEPSDSERTDEILSAAEARARIDALQPRPWVPDRMALLSRLNEEDTAETIWLHDGLDHDGTAAEMAETLIGQNSLRVLAPERVVQAVQPAPPEGSTMAAIVQRASADIARDVTVVGYAAEADGARRPLIAELAKFGEEDLTATAEFDPPLELRNRIAMFGLDGSRTAGGVALIDDRWSRRRVGLVSGERTDGGQRLLSGVHYVREALTGIAETREGTTTDLLEQNVDALIVVDVGAFPVEESTALLSWVEAGGLLIRFAGPTLAATAEEARAGFGRLEDPLLPVRLRPGGRDLGGAMSWGSPQRLAPFKPDSPFHGLVPPEDAAIAKQVLAEPDIDLPTRTWASLADGAPLVTADTRGDGRVVLIHTSADPRWSTLPISGLFVELLDRIIEFGSGNGVNDAGQSSGFWRPISLIAADGTLRPAQGDAQNIEGEHLGKGATAIAPPGLYEAVGGNDAGARRAHNTLAPESVLTPMPEFPAGVEIGLLGARTETELKPWFLAAALTLLLLDAIAALALSGKLRGAVAALMLFGYSAPQGAEASEDKALQTALGGAFGYIVTGDAKTDNIVQQGLFGLVYTLNARTSVEPPVPVAIDLENDELAVYPFIYWAITESQKRPTDDAIAKLNEYMRRGGMLMLDTRDQNLALASGQTPGTRALKRLTAGLDLPALAPVPEGHVLRRSFYLLDDFPGRWRGGGVWVEAVPPEDVNEAASSGGFKNDGVSPVIVGGRDWVGAWAMNDSGRPLLPMGSGGDRQREMALRFGINLIMYTYTGSYKSDQVHIPALLERLGQ